MPFTSKPARYHAFGVALNEFRRNSRWRKLVVTKQQFEAWLGTPEAATRKGGRLKLHLLMLLQRMPPDRQFQHWMQSRRD